jgi:hypothetical protein
MGYFIHCIRISVGILLFAGQETPCGTKKTASAAVQTTQKVVAPKAKKEIFISGSPVEQYLKDMSPDDVKLFSKTYASEEVDRALLELYGKEMQTQGKLLPNLSKYQQEFADALKKCDEGGGVLPGNIAAEVVKEKLNKLSSADIKSYYEKIKANMNAYPSASYYWPEGLPPYADNLSENIKYVLYHVWFEELLQQLSKQPIATLKTHPYYKKVVADCKESVEHGGPYKLSNPYVKAVHDFIKEASAQKIHAMTQQERQQYHKKIEEGLEGRPFATETNVLAEIIQAELLKDIRQKMSTEYTIKSDNQYILEAVKKAQNRTLFDPVIS